MVAGDSWRERTGRSHWLPAVGTAWKWKKTESARRVQVAEQILAYLQVNTRRLLRNFPWATVAGSQQHPSIRIGRLKTPMSPDRHGVVIPPIRLAGQLWVRGALISLSVPTLSQFPRSGAMHLYAFRCHAPLWESPEFLRLTVHGGAQPRGGSGFDLSLVRLQERVTRGLPSGGMKGAALQAGRSPIATAKRARPRVESKSGAAAS